MQEFPQSIAKEQATTERRMVSWDLVDAFSDILDLSTTDADTKRKEAIHSTRKKINALFPFFLSQNPETTFLSYFHPVIEKHFYKILLKNTKLFRFIYEDNFSQPRIQELQAVIQNFLEEWDDPNLFIQMEREIRASLTQIVLKPQ